MASHSNSNNNNNKDDDGDNNKRPSGIRNDNKSGKPPRAMSNAKGKLRNVANMVIEMRRQQSARQMLSASMESAESEEGGGQSQRSGFNRNRSATTEFAGSTGSSSSRLRRVHSSQHIPYHEKNKDDASSTVNTSSRSNNNNNAEPSPLEAPLFRSAPQDTVTTSNATKNLLDHAQHLEQLFQQGPSDSFGDLPSLQPGHFAFQWRDSMTSQQSLRSQPSIPPTTPKGDEHLQDFEADELYGSNGSQATKAMQDMEQGNDTTPLLAQAKTAAFPNTHRAGAQPIPPPRRMVRTVTNRWHLWTHTFLVVLQPREVLHGIQHWISTTVLCFIVPCLLVAAIFYYSLDNPDLEFLPTGACLSWFILLAVRQAVTLSLAQATQWALRVLTTRTTLFVRWAGPLAALVVMQSMGWPFLCASWGGWDLVILHGQKPWVQHWLHSSNIRLFSIQYNTGDGFLASDLYGRFLVALILVGVAAAAKRTFVALYLSRRMLQYYRPPLEAVMSRVKLIMEVAELAEQTQDPFFAQQLEQYNNSIKNTAIASYNATAALTSKQVAMDRKIKMRISDSVPTFAKTRSTSANNLMDGVNYDLSDNDSDSDDMLVIINANGEFNNSSDLEEDDDDDEHDDDATDTDQTDDPVQRALDDDRIQDLAVQADWDSLKRKVFSDRYTMKFSRDDASIATSDRGDSKAPTKGRHNRQSASIGGGTATRRGASIAAILPFLDRWQEPEDKGRKQDEPTLHDILQFRKALAFMDDGAPLSNAFGKTPTRKACVKNAVRIYKYLLNFTPQQPLLPFDVVGALAYREDGSLDAERAMDLLRLFQPDNNNMLSMLAFVQACDNVYKQLRFLRASLSNSSKIDSVLEDIFNVVFYLGLGVVIVFVCGFNPWPILVSLSTFTVSFAFAFGNSVAKWVEGILLIAVRRPYDIGDRISITGAETVANPGTGDTWIVEDISLTTTTLRYGGTNEVATINNASVANSRIVNAARSPRAIVGIKIRFHIDATQGQLDLFRRRLISYLEDHSRAWVGLIHYRQEEVNSDAGYVQYLFRAQHVKTWQELTNILVDKGDCERYADRIATEMGIIYESKPHQMTVGIGLAPESDRDKATDDRKRVAEFIQSISELGRHGSADAGDPNVRDAITEFYGGASGPTAAPQTEYAGALDGTTAMAPPGDGGGDGAGRGSDGAVAGASAGDS